MSDQERADVSPSQAGTNMEQTARRREGETMASFVLWCLLIFTWGVPSECAEEGPSPHGKKVTLRLAHGEDYVCV